MTNKETSAMINSFTKLYCPGINRSTFFVATLSILFYSFALFPSRNHWDTAKILELAREGKSSDQWTASYFRFLEALTFSGRFGMIPAILGLTLLVLAFLFFISSFSYKEVPLNLLAKLFLFSPFIGVFGMTLTHEVQSTTGVLILIGILIRKLKSNWFNVQEYRFLILFSALMLSMIHTGIFIFFGFCVAYFIILRKNLVFLTVIGSVLFLVTLFGHSILGVVEQGKALRYQSFLGDIKCIAQHPDAKISPSDWKVLLQSGSQEEWIAPSTCAYSQVYFAFPWVEKNQTSTLKLWLKLSSQNPQLALEARIQRAANVLPPLIFTAPQNAIAIDYLEPVGITVQDDLLVWSPLFKTSNDDAYQRMRFPKINAMKYLEAVAILPAHFLNRNSSLWGWAGLWLSVAILLLFLSNSLKLREILVVFLPQVFTCISLIMFSPISDPRYSMSVTLPSIVISALFLPELFKKIRNLNLTDAD
jgi:hypothetical protein